MTDYETHNGFYKHLKGWRQPCEGKNLLAMKWDCLCEPTNFGDGIVRAISEQFQCPEFPALNAFVVVRNEGVDPLGLDDLYFVARMYAYADTSTTGDDFSRRREYYEIASLVDEWYDGVIRPDVAANAPKLMSATEQCLTYASQQQAKEGLARKGDAGLGWDDWFEYDRLRAEWVMERCVANLEKLGLEQ